jgi:hypothetical protein
MKQIFVGFFVVFFGFFFGFFLMVLLELFEDSMSLFCGGFFNGI